MSEGRVQTLNTNLVALFFAVRDFFCSVYPESRSGDLLMMDSLFVRRLIGRASGMLAAPRSRCSSTRLRSTAPTHPARRASHTGNGIRLAAEALEPRAMLAVTATLTGSNLAIALGSASDTATLSSNGSTYTVSGTGLSTTPFSAGSVAAVAVSGSAGAGQQFTLSGSGL